MLEQKDFEKFIELALKRLIEMTKVHRMIMINGYNGSGNTVLLKNLSKNLENARRSRKAKFKTAGNMNIISTSSAFTSLPLKRKTRK